MNWLVLVFFGGLLFMSVVMAIGLVLAFLVSLRQFGRELDDWDERDDK
jgi:hypothetical protein